MGRQTYTIAGREVSCPMDQWNSNWPKDHMRSGREWEGASLCPFLSDSQPWLHAASLQCCLHYPHWLCRFLALFMPQWFSGYVAALPSHCWAPKCHSILIHLHLVIFLGGAGCWSLLVAEGGAGCRRWDKPRLPPCWRVFIPGPGPWHCLSHWLFLWVS